MATYQIETDNGTYEVETEDTPQQQSSSPSLMDTVGSASSKIVQTMPLVAGAISPVYGLAVDYLTRQAPQQSEELGGAIAEKSGEMGVNPYIGAGLGMAASIASNPLTYAPVPSMNRRLFRVAEPVIPEEKIPFVMAAEKEGIPLTRYELTGSKSSGLAEGTLENTFTGSIPFKKFREAQKLARESGIEKKISSGGTRDIPNVSGSNALTSMRENIGQANELSRDLYKKVTDVNIEHPGLMKALDEATYNNLPSEAKKVIDEVRGKLGNQSPVIQESFKPSFGSTSYEKQIPARIEGVGFTKEYIPASTENVPLQSQYRASPPGKPEVRQATNFQKLNDARNIISVAMQEDTRWNPILGNQPGETARALKPIKKALDADIQKYIETSEKSPYGKMESSEFNTSFTKAKTFYGGLKQLKNNKLVQNISKASPSDVADVVFKSGNIEDARIAQTALGDAGWASVKKQFFNDLMDAKNFRRYTRQQGGEQYLKEIFNQSEYEALRDNALLSGNIAKDANPSGSGRLALGGLQGGSLLHAASRAFTAPWLAALEAGLNIAGPYYGSKAYLASTHGIPINASLSKATSSLAKGLPFSNEKRRSLITQFVNQQSKGEVSR